MQPDASTYKLKIEAIRDLCSSRLARLANLTKQNPTQTFLFESEFFCGVAYDLGDFRTVWFADADEIAVFRKEVQIDTIQVDQTEIRRAA